VSGEKTRRRGKGAGKDENSTERESVAGKKRARTEGTEAPTPLIKDKANIMEVLTKAKVQLRTTCI